MKIVLCHGCFDILHIGHNLHLEAARKMGDYLIVSVSSDEAIKKIKPGRPVTRQADRVKQLMDLRYVSQVFLTDGDTGADSIRKFKPDIFVRGIDYAEKGLHPLEAEACREVNCEVKFTNTEKHSSSDLVKWI